MERQLGSPEAPAAALAEALGERAAGSSARHGHRDAQTPSLCAFGSHNTSIHGEHAIEDQPRERADDKDGGNAADEEDGRENAEVAIAEPRQALEGADFENRAGGRADGAHHRRHDHDVQERDRHGERRRVKTRCKHTTNEVVDGTLQYEESHRRTEEHHQRDHMRDREKIRVRAHSRDEGYGRKHAGAHAGGHKQREERALAQADRHRALTGEILAIGGHGKPLSGAHRVFRGV